MNSFVCVCVAGFSGPVGVSDINECISQPCQKVALAVIRSMDMSATDQWYFPERNVNPIELSRIVRRE
jgi:hypothetical protein